MKRTQHRRLAAGILLAALLVVLLLPFALAAEQALHDCAGADCAVCLRITAQMHRLLSPARKCGFCLLPLFLTAFFAVAACRRGAFAVTPCVDRVRLLN
ncbi:MAG: hypothetical protein IJK64_02530 [Clostridia bacterium]|nr:hypothetical protein [Clostridia bacterium]